MTTGVAADLPARLDLDDLGALPAAASPEFDG
ncbi:hypothetical protein JOE68_000077 [Saccharothrix algeriensis]|uniref:Uncharacterized protein n=1 Tax=Saccharothrix algeriensis TaxID=173560 RepID=A0ABS2RYZ0_9PSEU|nr:hypothetical protein [Saccharothrix algeriensis]